jgi:hypothetical protein
MGNILPQKVSLLKQERENTTQEELLYYMNNTAKIMANMKGLYHKLVKLLQNIIFNLSHLQYKKDKIYKDKQEVQTLLKDQWPNKS